MYCVDLHTAVGYFDACSNYSSNRGTVLYFGLSIRMLALAYLPVKTRVF